MVFHRVRGDGEVSSQRSGSQRGSVVEGGTGLDLNLDADNVGMVWKSQLICIATRQRACKREVLAAKKKPFIRCSQGNWRK